MILTRQHIDAYTNSTCFTKRQAELLEIKWPVTNASLDKLIGRNIPNDVFEAFKSCYRLKKRIPKIDLDHLKQIYQWEGLIYTKYRQKILIGYKGCGCGSCLKEKWNER